MHRLLRDLKGELKKFSALEMIAQAQAKKKERTRENMAEKQRAERDPQKETDTRNAENGMVDGICNLC